MTTAIQASLDPFDALSDDFEVVVRSRFLAAGVFDAQNMLSRGSVGTRIP